MAKIYSKKAKGHQKVQPSKATLDFLLNYSKALTMLKVGTMTFEHLAN
jgi:hypothetical protein